MLSVGSKNKKCSVAYEQRTDQPKARGARPCQGGGAKETHVTSLANPRLVSRPRSQRVWVKKRKKKRKKKLTSLALLIQDLYLDLVAKESG